MGLPRSLSPSLRRAPLHLSATGKGFRRNQGKESKEKDAEDEGDESDECYKTKEQTAEERGIEEKNKEEEAQQEREETEQEEGAGTESQSPSPPELCVFSGADPELGPQLQEAAAGGENSSPPHACLPCPPPTLWPHRTPTPQSDLSSHLYPGH